jgi:hypothetical protein
MNNPTNNHATPNPSSWPSPACRPYGPLLPLLRTGELAEEQAAPIREHLADCAECRARLADYDALYGALRRHFDPDVVAAGVRVPSAREIAGRSARPSDDLAGRTRREHRSRLEIPDEFTPATRGYTHRRLLPIRFETIAALLLVALLGALLAVQHYGWLGGPPSLNAQEQAYVAVLDADYRPLANAIGADSRQCVAAFDSAPASDKPQDMADCRPVEVTALTDSQTLLAHLQATPTPPQWRSADGQIKAWAQAQIDLYTARIQAIDARDLATFKTLGDQGVSNGSICDAMQQINADLPAENQFAASPIGNCG